MSFSPWIVLPVLVCLVGCGGPEVKEEPAPPPPPPTQVELGITATPGVNPDSAGRASPLLFRVYELKDLAAFDGAGFFALYGKEQETLGGDLVRKEEFMLAPGETKRLEFEADAATRHLAVFAAFRDLETARWRASAVIPRNRTTVVEVQLKGNEIVMNAQQKSEPPPPEPKPEE